MNESSLSISPPWPGMIRLESFDPEPPFDRRFEQIAQFRHDRGGEPEREDRTDRERSGDENEAQRKAERGARERAGDRARPRLSRRDARPQPRTADRAAGKIGGDVGAPDDGEQPQNRRQSVDRARLQEAEADDQRAGVERAGPVQTRLSGPPAKATAAPAPASARTAKSGRFASANSAATARTRAPAATRGVSRSRATIRSHSHSRTTETIHQKAANTIPPVQAIASAARPMTIEAATRGHKSGPMR